MAWTMTAGLAAAALLCAVGAQAVAAPGSTQVKALIAAPLTDVPGKEAMLVSVRYPPGGSDGIHRHDALVFVYVLQGSITMQVRGGPLVTLTKGQTFQEQPSDIHVVGRNASKTKPAEFLAFFVKNKGAAPVLPAE